MKLAKKVLSVVLAVAIALGAFAVAASANGNPDTAEYNAKIWLTGAVSDIQWTSKTKYSQTLGAESDPGATIEAQPGDEIMVRIYITNDYYVHTIQSNLFFSSGLMDAGEIYKADTGTAPADARRNKMQTFNTANDICRLYAAATGSSNCWSMQTAEANQKVEENWPTTDDGTELFNHDDWKWNRFFIYVTSGVGETVILEDEDNCIISMPVRIPADAAPGTTYTITIPEGIQRRPEKIYGATIISENGICADCGDEVCDIVDADAQLTPNMIYGGENQYIDYSEATLTVKIPGSSEPEVPEVNYDELNAKLTEAVGLLAKNITADSKAALNAAITAGNDALTAEDQETVNAAVAVLADAIANVKYLANFAGLNAAIDRYDALNPADWSNFDSAADEYAAATAIDQTNTADQDLVDDAAAALNAAIDALEEVVVLDYSALNAKIAEVKDTDTSIYTDETAAAFNAALVAAQNLVATTQEEINAALADLTDAFAALAEKDADYTDLETAKGKFTALNAKDWTVDSYAAAQAKYDEALAVPAGLKITAQATIDKAAAALEAAITALVPAAGADYTALNKAIADAEALVADNYVSFAGVAAALEAAKNVAPDLTANDQDLIDDATAALTDAMAALVEADADYSKVNAAITAADAILNKKDGGVNSYSDETLAAINAAKATVVTGLKKKDQDKVDAMAQAINEAISNAEFRPFDYSKINAHIEAIEANPADYYDANSYAAYLAAKEALVMDYTYENFAKAMLQQVNFLKVTVAVAGPADYSAVTKAQGEAEALDRDLYTAESLKAVDEAVAAVVPGLNANHQDEVDAMAKAINDAIAALEEIVIEYADYTAFDKAVADAKAVDAKLYTAASYAAFIEAVDEIVAGLAKNLLKADQAIVDEATAAIEAAYALLEKLADYSFLDEQILRAGTYDKNVWTADSWADVETALAAAKAVARGLGESAQDDIDLAANNLKTALDNVVAKEVVSSIKTINYTPADDTHNTFTVAVDGRPAMIQFIEMDGGTRTYDRYNKNVTIKSYNDAGEEVNSLDRTVAYEVWEIYTNLIGPDVKVRPKYLEGRQYIWETETYDFTLEFVEPTFDAEIRDIQPAAFSGKKGAIATTVVVGPDAQAIQFRMDNGTTTTYYASSATVLDNGDLEFTGKAWANHDGEQTIVIMVRVNNQWVEKGNFIYTVE